jgi:hypothetical protein
VGADRDYLLVIKPFSLFFAFYSSLFFVRIFWITAEAVCAVFDRPGPLVETFEASLVFTDQDPQGKVRSGYPRSFVSGKFGAQRQPRQTPTFFGNQFSGCTPLYLMQCAVCEALSEMGLMPSMQVSVLQPSVYWEG